MANRLPDDQRIVDLQNGILADAGIRLAADATILDFGCGSGRHVYEYLDHGFCAIYGYDVANRVELRQTGDIERFCFGAEGEASRIPFPDETFDFIYSMTVFEHVQQPEPVWREIRRVLKPSGVSLHSFPAKWRVIEPHMLVPLGGVISSYGWYRLWAALGVRNAFQRGLSAAAVARTNALYIANGLNYLGGKSLDRMLRGIFREVSWVELSFLRHSPGRSRSLYSAAERVPGFLSLFRSLHTRVVLLQK